MTEQIPIYDITKIDQQANKDLLIERFDLYLEKHYQHLHHPHRHSFYHLVLFTKGKGTHSIDFEKFPVQPFQIYFMIPGQVHSWNFQKDVAGYIVHFNESLITSFLHNSRYLQHFSFFNGNATDGVCQLPQPVQSSVLAVFEALLFEAKGEKELSMDVIRLKLLELFILVHRHAIAGKRNGVPQQKSLLFRNFQQLINEHFRTVRLPKEYAGLLYVTPNHLNALCQDLVGKTAGDLIRDRMLLEAKRLLTNAEMSVAEIAYELNFQDNSYFCRFFKKNVGTTPDDFRKTFHHS